MKRRGALLLVLVCCGVPESANPLVPAEKGVLDKALLGTWEGGDGKDVLTLVFAVKEGAVMTITAPRDAEHEPLEFEAHACTAGGAKFLNARALESGRPDSSWLIVRYQLDKAGVLTLFTLRDDAVREAIEKGTLKGESKGSPAQRVITDSVEKLRAFVAKKDVFEKFGTFKRK